MNSNNLNQHDTSVFTDIPEIPTARDLGKCSCGEPGCMGTVWPHVAAQRGLTWGKLAGLHQARALCDPSSVSHAELSQKLSQLINQVQAELDTYETHFR